MDSKKINRFMKIYPWYSGLTGDLLFYIAIDTLFLTVVKELSAAQIVSLTTVSTFACIILQFPSLWVIQKIGNTKSVRVGAFCLLASSVLITFGPNYYLVVLGRIFHDMAITFRNGSYVALENNLELIDKRGEYINLRTKANTVYAVITMLISFVASFMFNYNNYLPMYGCITTCAIGFGLSFFIVDYSKYEKISRKKTHEKVKFNYSKMLVFAILLYGLFYSIVQSGQSDGKLFIQQHLLLDFDVNTTSLIIGAMLCFSRVVRVLSNLAFYHIYRKWREKVGILLPSLLCSSIGLMLFGSFIPNVIFKIVVMSIGYVIILFIRDPFKLYIQDVVLDNTSKEYHQTILTVLEFADKVMRAVISLGFTLVLLRYPMLVVMAGMFIVALIEVVISIKLYKLIIVAKHTKELQHV